MLLVIEPPTPNGTTAILRENGERQVWERVLLLRPRPEYLQPSKLLPSLEHAWHNNGRYISPDTLRYLTTGTHRGLPESPPRGFFIPDEDDNLPAPIADFTPGTSERVTDTIGFIHTINVAAPGQPQQLRYFGRLGRSVSDGPTGQAHPTPEQAEADIKNWYYGRPVVCKKVAALPLDWKPTVRPTVFARRLANPYTAAALLLLSLSTALFTRRL